MSKGSNCGRKGNSDSNYRTNYGMKNAFVPQWKKDLQKKKMQKKKNQ